MKIIKIFLVFTLFISSLIANDKGLPKEYDKLTGKEKKEFFFSYLGKKIEIENKKILAERKFVLSLNRKKDLDKTSDEYKKLETLQKKYKVKNIYDYEKYLIRIDIIPPSQALAQAATESAWGKSRFMKVANNIFGHWTYNPKIGVVPQRRPEGKKHLIRVFPTLETSIAAYMRNLNRTGAYSQFRIQRAQMRAKGEFINGYILSDTMDKYSGIGHDYAKILKSIIRTSRLTNLDKKFYEENIKQLSTKKETNEIHSTTKI